jgi:hypothetical protein
MRDENNIEDWKDKASVKGSQLVRQLCIEEKGNISSLPAGDLPQGIPPPHKGTNSLLS